MQLNNIYRTLAPVCLALGIAAILDQYVPGFSVPGDPMTYAAFAIACALVGK